MLALPLALSGGVASWSRAGSAACPGLTPASQHGLAAVVGIHQRGGRLRRQRDRLLHLLHALFETIFRLFGAGFMAGDLAELAGQLLPAFVAISSTSVGAMADSWSYRFNAESPPVAATTIKSGGGGDGLGIGLHLIQPFDVALFGYLAPLGKEALFIGHQRVRWCAAGDHRASIASSVPVMVTLVDTMRCGGFSSVNFPLALSMVRANCCRQRGRTVSPVALVVRTAAAEQQAGSGDKCKEQLA